MVWRQLHDLRIPLNQPAAEDNPLIDRLQTLSRELDVAEKEIRGTFNYDEKFKWLESTPVVQRVLFREKEAEYAKIAKEREELPRTIRETMPDLHFKWTQTSSINDWSKILPEDGAVVVVNVAQLRCDAIIFSRKFGAPRHVPLANFSFKKAKDLEENLKTLLVDSGMLQRMGEAITETRAIRPPNPKSSPGTLSTILQELWEGVVQPVVGVLELSVSPSCFPVDSKVID